MARGAGVVALAAWCPPEDLVDQPAGGRLVFVHGTADRAASPEESLLTAVRARAAGAQVCRFVIGGRGPRDAAGTQGCGTG